MVFEGLKNIFSLGEMSREGRLITSVGASLFTFFAFIAITGDLYSGIAILFGVQIVLLYVFDVM
jgi:hypothetical protein